MTEIWPSVLLVFVIVLIPVDWRCVNRIIKNIKLKNGQCVLKYCKEFWAITCVICICLFINAITDAYSTQENIPFFLVLLKASWSIWALVATMIFLIKAFWQKGKQFIANQKAQSDFLDDKP